MSNILNAQDAFAALQNGKNLLCRYTGGKFTSLDDCPATVFGLPGYEFCIDIEKIELAGIKFTKPCTFEELERGQEVFVSIFSSASIYKTKFDNGTDMHSFLRCGVVQRDLENAELQMKAYHAFLGLNPTLSIHGNSSPEGSRIPKEDIERKQPKKRESKKAAADSQIEHNKDLIIDAIATCLTAEEVETTCYGLDGNGFNDSQQEQITAAKLAKLDQLAQEKATAESEDHELFILDKSEPELSVLCEAFIGEIMEATTPAKLNVIHGRINTSTGLEEYEHEILAKELELKHSSFSEQQAPVDINVVAAAAVAKAQKVDVETVQKNSERKPIEEEEEKYQSKLIELKKRVDESITPDEVNTVIKSTNSWSADQRQPLLQYMHKRLEVLQNEKAEKQPSLMVQIQNASDLTTLDALEIDVSAMDPIAQPEMMRYIRTRRAELEASAGETSIDEDLP
ncbi:hypothetical protein F966_02163 [Acinetobacter higginsii]|uniref:Uncharacterized protein n=1 Tax=Acinetobacter higginsii TaxID=70347 RepID=N8XR26_9GAMM|nr:hypothetical protein [Acinetobacter higginsii]ENV09505.1 hypothetical protein F966_02163 [Acinetobacter higginsii]